MSAQQTWKLAFQQSRWFTRGWTLQELIAPASVEFFSVEGQRLGDRVSMAQELHSITGVNVAALLQSPLQSFSVDERMSWAARRTTRREEDAAYSLLGIFDAHMPLIYGEGRKKALARLQKEIKEMSSEERANERGHTTYSYTRPTFHGPISGQYVIPGSHVTGGTVNFNFGSS